MSKLILKICVFILCIATYATLLSMVSIDLFTFRNWESLLWMSPFKSTIGPFYPNAVNCRDEEGDLGRNTKFSSKKNNISWVTDKNGFRNDAIQNGNYDVVIVGDSNVVGSGTSQEYMLTNQVFKMSGQQIFSYSSMRIDSKLFDNLSKLGIRPKLIIYEMTEHSIPTIASANFNEINVSKIDIKSKIFSNQYIIKICVILDRFWKKEPINYIKSRINCFFNNFNLPVVVGHNGFLFYENNLSNHGKSDKEISISADAISDINRKLNERDVKFIFMPIPNKETVYFNFIPSNRRNNVDLQYLNKLKEELTNRNVINVDTYSYFNRAALHDAELFFKDDTHLDKNGVRLTAQLLLDKINIVLKQ